MAQNKQVTEARIIDAAAQSFSRQGFHGTSTREIARLADVNEATLFRYFETKEKLFWSALEARLTSVRLRRELKTALQSDREPEVVVPMIVEFLVHTSLYKPEIMRLLYFSILELEAGAELVYRSKLGPTFELLRAYVLRCVERTSIKTVDPAIACIGLVTSVLAHQGLYRMLTGNALPFRNADETILAYSKFWLSTLVSNSVVTDRVRAGS
jgi:AcrR family transcriptional regulator